MIKYYLLPLLLLLNIAVIAQETLQIKVSDKQGKAIIGVEAFESAKDIKLGISNQSGIITILLDNINDNSNISFQHVSCLPKTILLQELKKTSTIVLDAKNYDLSEVVIKSDLPKIERLMNKLHRLHKKTYSSERFAVRYYGMAEYARLVESRGKTISCRHEYGLFLTTGNSKHKKFDLGYFNRHTPKYVARSYELTSNGEDTLQNLRLDNAANENMEFIAPYSGVENSLRAVYVFGPIFSNPDYFNFKYVNIEDNIYTISFQTKAAILSVQSPYLSKGYIEFDAKQNKLISMSFSSFEYRSLQLYDSNKQKCLVHRKPPKALPHEKEVFVKFKYDNQKHAYISNFTSNTKWVRNCSEKDKVWGTDNNWLPRPFAAKNKLVMREYWNVESYNPIPENSEVKDIAKVSSVSMDSGYGLYDEQFFENKPFPLQPIDSLETLNDYMPLKEQYKNNSNKPAYEKNYYQRYETKLYYRELLLKAFNQ